jgi:putative membrane protein
MATAGAGDIDRGTRLAIDRTRLAYERTMMAWVRTATSLISFGFSIYKFFQLQIESGGKLHGVLIGPREFALAMIGTGLTALLLSAVQHRHSMKQLRATYGHIPPSTAAIVAVLVGVLGVLALGAVVFQE